MVHTHVCEKDTVREDVRYFITSLTDVAEFADAVRKHWSMENQLYLEKAKFGRLSKKKMMFKAALNPQVLLDILFPHQM